MNPVLAASRLLVLTDRNQTGGRGLVPTVASAVEGGARAVVLREKDLCDDARAELAWSLRSLLDPAGGVLLLAGPDIALARALGAVAVHLAAGDPWPEPGHGLAVGRSCHGASEVVNAADGGADYVTLSPVFASASKPGYGPALGIEGLAAVAATVTIPVIALGGVTAATAGACLERGAVGVAVMGAVMAAEDPRAATAELVASLAGTGGAAVGHR